MITTPASIAYELSSFSLSSFTYTTYMPTIQMSTPSLVSVGAEGLHRLRLPLRSGRSMPTDRSVPLACCAIGRPRIPSDATARRENAGSRNLSTSRCLCRPRRRRRLPGNDDVCSSPAFTGHNLGSTAGWLDKRKVGKSCDAIGFSARRVTANRR